MISSHKSVYVIKCDKCKSRLINTAGNNSLEARQSICMFGWKYENNQDICPGCSKISIEKGISK